MDAAQYPEYAKQLLSMFLDGRRITLSNRRLQSVQPPRDAGDEVAANLLGGLLGSLGVVARRIELPEVWKTMDVWSDPDPETPAAPDLALLKRLSETKCLLEASFTPPTQWTIHENMSRLFLLFQDVQHRLTLEQQSLDPERDPAGSQALDADGADAGGDDADGDDDDWDDAAAEAAADAADEALEAILPRLWTVAPTVDADLLAGFRATTTADWGAGIYFQAPAFRSGVIVVNQLPSTPETLWLRLLGTGTVLSAAIAEVQALPADHPRRSPVLNLLSQWQLLPDTLIPPPNPLL